MRTLRGTPASAGVARGRWARIEPPRLPSGRTIGPGEADAQCALLADATEKAAVELEELAARVTADGHGDEGAIFDAQAMMARDPTLASMAEEAIVERHLDAIAAVLEAAESFAEQLRGLGDGILSARAGDVLDVGRRIARRAAGIPDSGEARLDAPAIVVADDLSPSVTATLPRDRLLGFALQAGSATAHAAILARAYGIPAVVGATGLLDALGEGELAIDGSTGEIYVDPDPATATELDRRVASFAEADVAARRESTLPAVTTDGVEVTLLANIGTPDEAGRAMELGAHGVGLFRTEFLFLERATEPSEDEQATAYRAAVDGFAPYPVTIRLLDVGGDKPIPYLPMEPEANPFLGVRALRLAATRPAIFLTQLRAAMRAAVAAPVKVMAPMVADADDCRMLLDLAAQARADLEARRVEFGPIDLGVMLEIPAAILVGDAYFGWLSFASLGTNDLLQYTLAVDRGNPALARYQDSLHPALLALVSGAVERADRAGIELSVCGEMAGDPVAALALVGLGIRKLSMASGSLAAVRRAIRSQDLATLRSEASAALADGSAAAVRSRFGRLAGRSAS